MKERAARARGCARITAKRWQVANPFTTRTYDLVTGKRILLPDIFPEDSAAWALLAGRVRERLMNVFPAEPRDEAAIDALCDLEALKAAEFTLGGSGDRPAHHPVERGHL